MGAGNSKPTNEPSQLIFSADAPVRFSNELVDSLQNSTQSDFTRTKHLESQIQARVTAELEKLQQAEHQRLAALEEQISAEPEPSQQPPSSLTEKIGDALSSPSTLEQRQRQRNLGYDSVSKEIAAMKQRLETRRKLEQPDPAVEKAKAAVVECLRTHDRRPLDCWREVEEFRTEVGRLEREFVERTVR